MDVSGSYKIHTPTLAIIISIITFLVTSYYVAVVIEHHEQIGRLNKAARALCSTNMPTHHMEACVEIGSPLAEQISPFSFLRPSQK